MATMLYQGHGSYRFTTENGTVIYVDPWAGTGYDLPADVIIVTHEHFDHTATDKMPHAEGCKIYRAHDLHPEPDVYLSVSTHGIRLTAVPACNENRAIDDCMGVVLELDETSFYASGDTSTTDWMRDGKLEALGLDYAALPGDGVYNMDIAETSECAKMVDARHSIPVHLCPVGDPADAVNPEKIFDREKAEAFRARGRIVLEPGEELGL